MNKKNIEAIYSLSGAQQGMLFESLYAPDSGIHIEQFICNISNLNVGLFEQSWQRIVQSHATFRTGFVWKQQDEPLQIILRQVEVLLTQQDWRKYTLPEQQQQLQVYLASDRSLGFNLSKPPLIRLALFQTSDDTYQFVWTHHHILMDGWCGPLVFQELFSFYQALSKRQQIQLPPTYAYKDYINWLKKQDLSQTEAFWRNTLQEFKKPTLLGIKVESSSFSDSEAGYVENIADLQASLLNQLQSLAKAHRLTLNTLVQGIWALLLSRYSQEEDVVFGITVSGRPPDLAGVESMIGLFINTLPLKIKVSPQSDFWLWLKEIQSHNVELRQYEFTPTGLVHQWSELPGSLPLYESILVFENYPTNVLVPEFAELKIDIFDIQTIGAQTKYSLTLLIGAGSELTFKLVYDQRRFPQRNVSYVLEHFVTLLNSIIAKPKQSLAELLAQIPTEQIPQYRVIKSFFQPRSQKVAVAPGNLIEEVLAQIWTGVMGIESLSIDDNFFELGGHSLLATQMMSRVRNAFQIELPLGCLFEAPTIFGLAKFIQTEMTRNGTILSSPILPISRQEEIPLSFAQERLWFIDQLKLNSIAYNLFDALSISGLLNIVALEQSFNEIVQRHEILRTAFPAKNGQPVCVIAPTLTLNLPVVDLQELKATEQEAEVLRLATQEAEQPFNLADKPLLRAKLLKLGAAEHVILFVMHHIIFDGWSSGVLIQELTALYEAFSNGKPSPLPELSIQYADFAHWQRQWLQGKTLEAQLSYWQQQLAGAPGSMELEKIGGTPLLNKQKNPTVQSFILAPELCKQLKTLSRQEGVTLFMTLLAIFQTLLYRYTNQADIVVGTDVANRNRTEIEPLIGFFVNLLVLRTDLSGNPSFRQLLGRVREVAIGAYSHQDLPFAKLVEVLQPDRTSSHTPLFQVLFVLQNAPMAKLEFSDLTLSPLEINTEKAKFNLALFMEETEQGIIGVWKYNTDLFHPDIINSISNHFQTLANSVVAQPDTRINFLEILTTAEKREQIIAQEKYEKASFNKFKSIKPKVISFTQEQFVKTDFLKSEDTLPLVIQPNISDLEQFEWAKNQRDLIEKKLLQYGAILFRGFQLNSVAEFENFAQTICPELFDEYGDLPREGISGKVYSSTPYPSDQAILFHNESSHLHQWPLKIWFFCVQAAQQAGETPIVDCRKIYQLLDPKLREKFEQKQLMYVRNYIQGLDVSWQEFFHTTDKKVVENYCCQVAMEFDWLENNGLKTRLIRPAVVKHPYTRETVFFNQIQLHHIYCLETAVQTSLLSTFGEENLPRHVYYGDGSPIEESVIEEIRSIYQQATVSFPWQPGDVLMLDNMLTAHGRNPYIGSRKVVVAMGEMIQL